MGRSELIGLSELLAKKDYPLLKSRLTGGLAVEEWAGLSPVLKLAVFKLMEPAAAMAFFATLGFEDKYLLFSGFEPGSIAPLTEDLPPGRRALFEKLGADAYGEMLRRLSAAEPRVGAAEPRVGAAEGPPGPATAGPPLGTAPKEKGGRP